MRNKLLGALYGLSIGDALGAPTEFMKEKTIRRRYGWVNSYKSGIMGIPFFLRLKGQVTDDTRMSLAVLKGIIQNPENPYESIGEEFICFRNTFPALIGNNLMLAFWLHNENWENTSKRVNTLLRGKTAGNGALMRSLPVVLCYSDYEKMLEVTKNQAVMTHLNPLSTESCIIYNSIAFDVLNGIDLKESIVRRTKNTTYESSYLSPKLPPNGFCVASLSWTLYWLYHSNSLEEAILGAVNKGLDTDTIASLVGGIAGLYYGFESIPSHWVKGLRLKDDLNFFVEQILHIRNDLKDK